MTQPAQVLLLKKLKGQHIILEAARHNLRELPPAENIDVSRSHGNVILHGPQTAQEAASTAQTMLDDAGVKALRKDAVQALEILFGLPPASGIDEVAFFRSAAAWAGCYFTAPVISAIVHNDEASPHCHVLILPLVNGRMNGSEMMGNRAKLLAMQTSFHNQVAQCFGLAKPATQRRASAADRRRAAGWALDAMKSNLARLNDPAVAAALCDLIAADPARLLAALGADMPKAGTKRGQAKTFVVQMTKPCTPQPAKPIRLHQDQTLVGFAGSDHDQKQQTLSCVGFADSPTSIPTLGPQPSRQVLAHTSVLAILARHPETVETHLKRVQAIAGPLRGGP